MKRKVTPRLEQEIKDIYVSSYPPISLEFLAKKYKISPRKIYQISSNGNWTKCREEKQSEYSNAVKEKTKEKIEKNAVVNAESKHTARNDGKAKSILDKIAENRYRVVDLMNTQLDKIEEWQASENNDPRDILVITNAIAKASETIAKAHGDDINTTPTESTTAFQDLDESTLRNKIKGYAEKIKS